MSMSNTPGEILWIDFETTGLDEHAYPIEMAFAFTDADLTPIGPRPEKVIITEFKDRLDEAPQAVLDMHGKNGLRAALDKTVPFSVRDADVYLRSKIAEVGCVPRLGGSGVHFDRNIVNRFMPKTKASIHYRNVDVSVFYQQAVAWAPELAEASPGVANTHRALDDVVHSIESARFWKKALFEQ